MKENIELIDALSSLAGDESSLPSGAMRERIARHERQVSRIRGASLAGIICLFLALAIWLPSRPVQPAALSAHSHKAIEQPAKQDRETDSQASKVKNAGTPSIEDSRPEPLPFDGMPSEIRARLEDYLASIGADRGFISKHTDGGLEFSVTYTSPLTLGDVQQDLNSLLEHYQEVSMVVEAGRVDRLAMIAAY